jgi:hypothetical protein
VLQRTINEMASFEGEAVCTSAVHNGKALVCKHNAGMPYGPFFIGLFVFAVAKNMVNLCVAENGCIEIDRILCFPTLLTNKHESRRNPLLHCTLAHKHHLP